MRIAGEPSGDGLSAVKRALLAQRRHRVGPGEQPVLPTPRSRAGAPLSFAQQRLWLLDQLVPEVTAYNVVRAVRLAGRLDIAALTGAVALVVARHEVLRGRVVVVDGLPRFFPHPPSAPEVPVDDLRAAPDPAAAVRAALQTEADRRFDLSADVLLRARLLREADEIWVLVLSTHHLASDEASRSILYAELAAAYAALLGGRVPELPPLPVQYADWAAWQRDRLGGPALAGDLDWWRDQLAGAPDAVELPTERSTQGAAVSAGFGATTRSRSRASRPTSSRQATPSS